MIDSLFQRFSLPFSTFFTTLFDARSTRNLSSSRPLEPQALNLEPYVQIIYSLSFIISFILQVFIPLIRLVLFSESRHPVEVREKSESRPSKTKEISDFRNAAEEPKTRRRVPLVT